MSQPIVITVPFAPMSVSKLNKHWAIRNKQREIWETWIKCMCPAPQRAHLRWKANNLANKLYFRIELHHARFFDDDNKVGCLKPVFDAMKQLGYLHDDKPKYMELVSVVQVKCPQKSAKTVIEITEA